MTILSVFDIGLAVLILGIGASTIAAREAFTAVIGFVVYGLLLAIAWVRLSAVDVALTEAAIGGGMTGMLMLGAVARLRFARGNDTRTSLPTRLAAGVLCALVAAGVATAILLPPEVIPTLAPTVMENLAQSGLGNPVAGVLFVYRALDTLLEKVVLLLALLGVWSLAPDRVWGGIPGLRVYAQPGSTLTFLAQLLPPVGNRGGNLYVLGRRERTGRRLSRRHGPRRDVAPCHDRGPEERTFDQPALVTPAARRRTGDFPCHRTGRDGVGECLSCLSIGLRQTDDCRGGGRLDTFDRRGTGPAGRRAAGTGATAMNAATLFGLCGAALMGFGLYGLITNPEPLRKILAFNLLGSGVFLVFGVVARRAAASGLGGDPVPQAMVITAIVVAFAATAMAIALVLRLLQETGRATLDPDNPGGTDTDRGNS